MSGLNTKEYLLNTASKDKWMSLGTQKRAGIAVPLFSLYSQESLGIGEFVDLKLLIDWAKKTGNSIIQLLPLNEAGPFFCPYDTVSSFALEPAYISLRLLAQAKEKPLREKIEALKTRWPQPGTRLDYGIKRDKTQLLWDMFVFDDEDSSAEFRKFREENSYWLLDFSLFKVLKGYQRDLPWYEWEDKYRDYTNTDSFGPFRNKHEREIRFQMWVQWKLYQQLKEIKGYAKSKNILLKGDLPFLVSRDSADVWQHPEFFKLKLASGAPPDMYCAKGQRWGMPTYNWEMISTGGYRYLKEKLKYAENFYDILRIDHVVGLFRIWSIPYDEPQENEGLNGFFDPLDENKWEEHGRNILSVMLKSTNMLLCAEDLGVIPKACPQVLEELGIPGSDVQRWAKDWKLRHDFLSPREYRPLSAAMLSTLDTTNWPAWWENEAGTVDEELFKRRCLGRGIDYESVRKKLFDLQRSYYGRLRWLDGVNCAKGLAAILGKPKEEINDFIDMYENSYQEKEKLWKYLDIPGPMREEPDAEIIRAALKITLASESIFCINTLIDYLYLAGIFKGGPYQYRINTPGTISQDNWSLVIPLSLEALLENRACQEIKGMIMASGRA